MAELIVLYENRCDSGELLGGFETFILKTKCRRNRYLGKIQLIWNKLRQISAHRFTKAMTNLQGTLELKFKIHTSFLDGF